MELTGENKRRKSPKQIISELKKDYRIEDIEVYNGKDNSNEWIFYYCVDGWINNDLFTVYFMNHKDAKYLINHSSAINEEMKNEIEAIILKIEPRVEQFFEPRNN